MGQESKTSGDSSTPGVGQQDEISKEGLEKTLGELGVEPDRIPLVVEAYNAIHSAMDVKDDNMPDDDEKTQFTIDENRQRHEQADLLMKSLKPEERKILGDLIAKDAREGKFERRSQRSPKRSDLRDFMENGRENLSSKPPLPKIRCGGK